MIAAPASSSEGSSFLPLLLVAGLIGLMYFMVIRPQSKRRKQMQEMQASAGVGATVITIGGLYGKVVSTDDETVMLEIAPGVVTRYARGAIGKVLPDGELGSGSTDTAGEVDDDVAGEAVEGPAVPSDGKTRSDGAESR